MLSPPRKNWLRDAEIRFGVRKIKFWYFTNWTNLKNESVMDLDIRMDFTNIFDLSRMLCFRANPMKNPWNIEKARICMTCCSLVFQTTGTTNTQVPAPDHGHVSLTNKDMLPTKHVTLYSTFPSLARVLRDITVYCYILIYIGINWALYTNIYWYILVSKHYILIYTDIFWSKYI